MIVGLPAPAIKGFGNRLPYDFAMARRIIDAAVIAVGVVVGADGNNAQELARGVVVDRIACLAEPSQTYALYLPSTYSPDRGWSLLIGFHPAANGRAIVEKYRAAAEQYGYIVAASNNSRNGPMSVSATSVEAMSRDLGQRFAIDASRVYATGHSGGARVAMLVGLSGNNLAGVIASSAGFPDSQPRAAVSFAVFGTAGTEDFNYIEMRLLDKKLTSPHRLAIFKGGHTLPPDEVALDAIEWLELQAMKSNRRERDEAFVDRLLEKRRKLVESAGPTEVIHQLTAIVADFTGLRDVSAESTRAATLSKQPEIKKALARERDSDDSEMRMLVEVFDLEGVLRPGAGGEGRSEALARLRDRLSRLFKTANSAADSPERSRARRVLRNITSGAAGRVQDPEYLKLLEQYRRPLNGPSAISHRALEQAPTPRGR
jgi:hypothetical protein